MNEPMQALISEFAGDALARAALAPQVVRRDAQVLALRSATATQSVASSAHEQISPEPARGSKPKSPAEEAGAMSIELRGIHKNFRGYTALDGIDLDIREGEFLALLGPSGSGKTTLLRILAGLDFPDSGSMLAEGRDLSAISVRERGVGLVFQHYALFRHMTVFENVAFGLRVRPRRERPGKAEITRRVTELLERVQLADLAKRFPAQLSGGQRQRVALARAHAVEPKILLLDEPFGALDAQVRKELRRWLRHLHEEMKLTSIFVTHDQEEALELSDRVVVMNRGRIEQIDTPERVYDEPATPFVYEFIGSANRFECRIEHGAVHVGKEILCSDSSSNLPDGPALAFVRPQHWRLLVPTEAGLAATISHIYAAGSVFRIELKIATLAQTLEAELPPAELHRLALQQGSSVKLFPQELTLFAANDQRYILRPA